MKTPPQVIVGLWLPDGCYYIPLCNYGSIGHPSSWCHRSSTLRGGLKMPTSENGAVYSGRHRSYKQKEMDAQSAGLMGT